MTSECLYNLVQWRDVCTADSRATTYVNDLPGFPVDAFELLADRDFDTGQKVWDKIQKRAAQTLVDDIQGRISATYKIKSILSDVVTGRWVQPFAPTAIEGYYRGIYVNLQGSENLELHIGSIRLYVGNYVDTQIDSNIHIYNLDTGELLESFPFSSNQNGFLVVPINKTYTGYSIGVFWDQSEIQSRTTEDQNRAYYDNKCKSCCSHTITSGQPIRIAKSGEIIRDNIEHVSNAGAILSYSVMCGLSNWICINKGPLTSIYQHLLGLELAVEIMASRRVNSVTLASDQLEAFADYCNKGYRAKLENFTNGLTMKDPICAPCSPKIQKIALLP